MTYGPQQPWSPGQQLAPPQAGPAQAGPRHAGPPQAARRPSTAPLTVSWVLSSIFGFAYIGLFVLMGVSAGEEITQIEQLRELKAGGAPITNTDEDLLASIAENELGMVVFFTGTALTIPLLVAGFLGRTGRGWARVLATVCLVPPTVVIVFSVLHDINDGHPENAFAMVFTLPAIVLAVLWWLPATSRAMAARRWQRTAVRNPY
jgi:hypothetical protein